MKFTVALVTLLSISSAWAVSVKPKPEDPKDKREAPVGYASGLSAHSYQAPSLGHGDASAISIGAGYSVGGLGGSKPSYSFEGQDSGAGYQLSAEGLQPSGHSTIQLAPIQLQSGNGLIGTDLNQLMSQLQHGLDSGAITLQSPNGLGGSYLSGGQGSHGAQEVSLGQLSYGAPKLQQYNLQEQPSNIPSYAAGTKGLGSYSSTGPVLFNPADSASQSANSGHTLEAALPLGESGHSFPSFTLGGSGHSSGGAGYSLGGSGHSLASAGLSLGNAGHSLGGSGHSYGGQGLSLGGSGHSLGGPGYTLVSGGSGHSLGSGSGHSLGSSGYSLAGLSHGGSLHSLGGSLHSLGGSGHSLGASGHSHGGLGKAHGGHSIGGSYKSLGSSYAHPGKASFKPSAFLGSTGSDSLHGLSGSYGTPSFGSSLSGGHALSSGGHGASFGGSLGGSSAKFASSYLPPKSAGFGSSLESVASFSSGGHIASLPGTTYGVPSSAYELSNSANSASSSSPQYYLPSKQSSSFGESYRAPSSSHGSISSFSSGPKYSFGGHSSPSSRYGAPKDIQGSYSESSYNTIKYSQELPSMH